MAGGFHVASLGQLGNNKNTSQDDLGDLMGSLEKGESVQIVALSEEDSQAAAQILEQRRKQSNPVQAYMRNLQCDSYGEVNINDADGLRRPKPKDNSSPLWRMVVNSMPIMSWFPKLTLALVRQDVIAGLTVGVMVIPQSMSYANIAGLDYIYGMYSAFLPTLVYGFFGQSRQLAVGPVAMVSLLVEAGLRDKIPADMARSPECKAWFEGNTSLEQYAVCPTEYAELAMLVSWQWVRCRCLELS